MVVRHRSIPILLALAISSALALCAAAQTAPAPSGAAPAQTSQQPAQQAAQQAPASRNALAVVVLDPAHGGVDQGAHGSSGIVESEIVLSFARLLRISLEAQGLKVILTRQANEGLSFDGRSRIANAQQGVIFITLHFSSTGPAGTVRVYSLPQPAAHAVARASSPAHPELVRWDDAQKSFLDSSRKLAELIQIQMAQRFPGSPEAPMAAAVRQLRTVAAPAVAIEVSNVSLPDRAFLDQMAPVLADSVARAVAAFRLVYETGVK
jgi:N-acetylmuramoyl-L-alanine amidase